MPREDGLTARLDDVRRRLMGLARARDEIGANAPERAWLSERVVELIDELEELHRDLDAANRDGGYRQGAAASKGRG
jgi:hypothetical protein